MTYEFAIQQDTLNSGLIVNSPKFRAKSKFKYFNSQWMTIAKIDGLYRLYEHSQGEIPNLTPEECEERIQGYKAYLREKHKNQIRKTDFLNLHAEEDGEVKQRFLPTSMF